MTTNLFRAFAATGALALVAGPALSHDEGATAGGIHIEGIAATPARSGETSRVTFTIENDGPDRAVLVGLLLPTGEPSQVRGFLGVGHSAAMAGVRVGAGDVYGLGDRTAWIDIGPLRNELPDGATVPAVIRFDSFDVPITLHVGGMPAAGASAARASR
ncbi:MAG: hypothetical protein INR63_29575 [Actinomycetospora chiangmaiensis]|nr:hypothetical protein [Actinomycetospora chiangmaiensis]